MKQHILEGKTITSIDLAKDKHAIRFNIEGGEPIIALTYGDCCSTTWIESVELPVNGFPATVITAVDIDMPDLGSPDQYEVIAYYGLKITTDKGEIKIDYRNESNGYYGGSLEWPGECLYSGVYGQNESSMNFEPIKAE